MLIEDIQDLGIAFVLLIILLFVGCSLRPVSTSEDKYIYEDINLRDEESVFFLNLLKNNVEDKNLADLIILSENNKDLKDLLEKVDKEIKEALEFYGKDEYGLKIIYPDNKEEYLGCDFEIENGIVQKLPSLNKGIIELRFKFQGGECFISPI